MAELPALPLLNLPNLPATLGKPIDIASIPLGTLLTGLVKTTAAPNQPIIQIQPQTLAGNLQIKAGLIVLKVSKELDQTLIKGTEVQLRIEQPRPTEPPVARIVSINGQPVTNTPLTPAANHVPASPSPAQPTAVPTQAGTAHQPSIPAQPSVIIGRPNLTPTPVYGQSGQQLTTLTPSSALQPLASQSPTPPPVIVKATLLTQTKEQQLQFKQIITSQGLPAQPPTKPGDAVLLRVFPQAPQQPTMPQTSPITTTTPATPQPGAGAPQTPPVPLLPATGPQPISALATPSPSVPAATPPINPQPTPTTQVPQQPATPQATQTQAPATPQVTPQSPTPHIIHGIATRQPSPENTQAEPEQTLWTTPIGQFQLPTSQLPQTTAQPATAMDAFLFALLGAARPGTPPTSEGTPRTNTWPTLEEALTTLQTLDPDLALATQQKLPQLTPKLMPAIATFLAALSAPKSQGSKLQDVIGADAIERLESAGHTALTQRLRQDLSSLQQLWQDNTDPQWQTALLPIWYNGQFEQARLQLSRQHETPDAPFTSTRFRIDVSLSSLGPIQFEGLFTRWHPTATESQARKHFALAIRSEIPLPEEVDSEINRRFHASLSTTGISGKLDLKHVPTIDKSEASEASINKTLQALRFTRQP